MASSDVRYNLIQPRIFCHINEYPSHGRSKEDFLCVLPELLAVDVHVQLEFNVLWPVDTLDQLDDHLARTELLQMEVIASDSWIPRLWIASSVDIQVELESTVRCIRSAHREQIRRDVDQLALDGDEVGGVGQGGVHAFHVTLGAGERLALTSDVVPESKCQHACIGRMGSKNYSNLSILYI